MRRRWIVDSSNVVGSRPDGWWRDRPRALRRLLDELVRWRAVTGEPVLVVADGHPSPRVPEGTITGVHVWFARSTARDAADDEIVRIVGQHRDPATLIVVTSDSALRERVTALGAQVVGAGAFLSTIADIEPRRADRAVLAHFGADETALLGRGGEARVFALDDDRVVRLPHHGVDVASLEARRRFLDSIRAADVPFAVPEVLDHVEVEGRTVVLERRLPGRDALEALAEPGTDRGALIRSHLDAAAAIADLPCPSEEFGELWGGGAISARSFADWAEARLEASLRLGGDPFADVDPAALTADLVRVLPQPPPARPALVHLDAFLGNMLADGDRITAVLDFGPMTIGGPRHLDPAVAVAYLAPEITPTAGDEDRETARRWAIDAGIEEVLEPAERWMAAYWAGAVEDPRLQRWCRRILT